MKTQKSSSSADKKITLIMVLIIAVVAVAGICAIVPKLQNDRLENAIMDGTAPQTVETYAAQAGQSVEEYLAEYEITDSSINGDTDINDMVSAMNVKNFAKFSGMEYIDFTEQYGLTDKVTEDTLWSEAENLIPLGIYIGGDDQVDMFKEYYGFDESINAQTPWGDIADIVAEKDAQMLAEMEAAAAATEAPETEAAEGDAEATEAPAAE